jgi:hypothetical protein
VRIAGSLYRYLIGPSAAVPRRHWHFDWHGECPFLFSVEIARNRYLPPSKGFQVYVQKVDMDQFSSAILIFRAGDIDSVTRSAFVRFSEWEWNVSGGSDPIGARLNQ